MRFYDSTADRDRAITQHERRYAIPIPHKDKRWQMDRWLAEYGIYHYSNYRPDEYIIWVCTRSEMLDIMREWFPHNWEFMVVQEGLD